MERRRFQRVQSYGAPLISLHLEASSANIVSYFIPFHPCIREGDPLIRSANTTPVQRACLDILFRVDRELYGVFSANSERTTPCTPGAAAEKGRNGRSEEERVREREGRGPQ